MSDMPQHDHETRVVDTDHVALKLWLRLLTCTNNDCYFIL